MNRYFMSESYDQTIINMDDMANRWRVDYDEDEPMTLTEYVSLLVDNGEFCELRVDGEIADGVAREMVGYALSEPCADLVRGLVVLTWERLRDVMADDDWMTLYGLLSIILDEKQGHTILSDEDRKEIERRYGR